jgi:hypothetical protein
VLGISDRTVRRNGLAACTKLREALDDNFPEA